MKRRRRNSNKAQIDMLKPIKDVLAFGSKDDPCFAKHYSPEANECNRCGDNELCCIAMAQKSKIKRSAMAEKESFKDLEDVNIDLEKALKNIVITNKVTSFLEASKLIQKKFGYAELDEAKEAIRKAVKVSKIFKIVKRDGKRHIKNLKA